MKYRVRCIGPAVWPCYVIETVLGKGQSGAEVVWVGLPPQGEDIREERRQMAEAICRMLNGQLL